MTSSRAISRHAAPVTTPTPAPTGAAGPERPPFGVPPAPAATRAPPTNPGYEIAHTETVLHTRSRAPVAVGGNAPPEVRGRVVPRRRARPAPVARAGPGPRAFPVPRPAPGEPLRLAAGDGGGDEWGAESHRARDVRSEWPGIRSGKLPVAARRALGGLLPVIDDPELRDVLVQVRGGSGELWLDRGGQLQRVREWRATPNAIHRLATALIAAGGRHLDELVPAADVRLGDGIRVHAVLPPVAVAGASVSIRVPRSEPLDFATLSRAGLCSPRLAERLRATVRARKNLLITGGTGTGKTTLMGALLDLSSPEERIVTIEDLAELRLRHPHVVALEARQASSEGLGKVGLDALLREALRMRPDRVVLGECRGAEIATLLTALNTGHDGGAGTLHASSVAEIPARLEALGALAGMTPATLGRQAAAAFDLVIHLSRDQGLPRITGIGQLRHDPRSGLSVVTGDT